MPGLGGTDALLLKVSGIFGTVLWTRIWGTGANDSCNDLVLSGDRIHAVGSTSGSIGDQTSAGLSDLFVSTFDSNGNLLWTRQRGSGLMDTGELALVRPDGLLILLGNTRGSFDGQTNPSTGRDVVVLAYDPEGNHLWTRFHGTTGDDLVHAAAFDQAGNLWITGSTTGAFPGQSFNGETDVFLLRITPAGAFSAAWQWGTGSSDAGRGVVVDPQGNVWVAGYAYGSLPGQPSWGIHNLFLTRYSPSGVRGGTSVVGSYQSDIASDLALGIGGCS